MAFWDKIKEFLLSSEVKAKETIDKSDEYLEKAGQKVKEVGSDLLDDSQKIIRELDDTLEEVGAKAKQKIKEVITPERMEKMEQKADEIVDKVKNKINDLLDKEEGTDNTEQ